MRVTHPYLHQLLVLVLVLLHLHLLLVYGYSRVFYTRVYTRAGFYRVLQGFYRVLQGFCVPLDVMRQVGWDAMGVRQVALLQPVLIKLFILNPSRRGVDSFLSM